MGVWSLGQADPLEEGMATHSSILAWRIPWTEEPGGLRSFGLWRVGHNLRDLACMHLCYLLSVSCSHQIINYKQARILPYYILSGVFVLLVSCQVSFLFSKRIKRLDMVEVLKGKKRSYIKNLLMSVLKIFNLLKQELLLLKRETEDYIYEKIQIIYCDGKIERKKFFFFSIFLNYWPYIYRVK